MLALYSASEPIDVLTVTEHLRSRGKLEEAGGQAEIDALTAAVAERRQRCATTADRPGAARSCAACSTATYEIQASVHGHEAQPRDLVERAERAMLEVAHDDRQKDFRKVGDVLHAEIDKWQKLSAEGQHAHRHAVGLRRPRRDHRRLPARQPHHHRRAPVDGQVARSSRTSPRTSRSTSDRPRPVALFSLEMSEAELAQRFIASQAAIKGDDLRKGRLKDERKWKRVLRRRRRVRRRRRCSSTTPPTSASSRSARRRGGCTSSAATAASA